MQNIVNKTEREHILVCLSPYPSNERIVRMAVTWHSRFVEVLLHFMFRHPDTLP